MSPRSLNIKYFSCVYFVLWYFSREWVQIINCTMTKETIVSRIIPILAGYIFVVDSELLSVSLCPASFSGFSLFTTKSYIFIVVNVLNWCRCGWLSKSKNIVLKMPINLLENRKFIDIVSYKLYRNRNKNVILIAFALR